MYRCHLNTQLFHESVWSACTKSLSSKVMTSSCYKIPVKAETILYISADFIGTKRRKHPVPKPSSKQGASMRNTCTIHCPTWLSLFKFPPNFSLLPPSSQPMTYNDQSNRYRFCFLGYLWYPITYTIFNSDLRVGDTASHSRCPSFLPYLNLALCFKEPKLWIYYTADKGS